MKSTSGTVVTLTSTSRSVIIGLLWAALTLTHLAQAGQQRYWTGDGVGPLWSDPLNWIPRSPPESGDDLVIEKSGEFTPTSMVNDLVGLSIHSMSFEGLSVFTTDWYLDGNDLSLTGNITFIGFYSQDVRFNCGVTLGQSVDVVLSPGDPSAVSTFRLNGALNLNSHNLDLVSRQHGIFRISSTITGQGNIRVVNQDTSDVALAVFGGASPNTFSGALIGSSAPGAQTCRLSFDKPGGDVVTDQLSIGPGGEVILQRADQIGDDAVVSVSGGGRLLLNGHSETLGTLLLTNDQADAASTLVNASGTTLTLHGDLHSWDNNSAVVPTITGTLNLPTGLHLFDIESPSQYSGLNLQAQITGVGGFTKLGNAALVLTSSNNFSGSVAVSEGIVDVYDAHALGSTARGLTLFDGSLTLRNVIISDKTLFVRGTHTVTPNSAGSLLTCYGVGGWLGRIELDTNLVVYSTDLCFIGGPIVGLGGMEFLGSRNQLVDAAIQPNPFTYTGTTRALCELLVVSANNPFHGPVVVGGTGILTGPSVEMRWANSVNNGLPDLTLQTNGFANLNGRNDTWSRVTFNGGHISTGAGRVAIADIIVHPTNMTAIIDGNLLLSSSPTTKFDIGDGSVDSDLLVNAVILDGANVIGIEKAGDGKMDLVQANTYRGATFVGAGTLGLLNNNSLGATSQGTTVASGATVAFGVQVDTVLEPFTIAGAGVGGTNGALVTVGDVWINTNIVLSGPAAIRTQGINSEIQVNNVGGTGPLTKLGSGRLVLRGNANNTYSGDTRVTEGVLDLAKPTGTASVPGHLIIGTTASGFLVPSARVEHRASFTIVGSVTVNAGGLWNLNGAAEGFSVPDLQGHPPLTLNNGGSVQTGTGIFFLPVGGDIVVNPGLFGSSIISGQIGLDPGSHHLIVSRGSFSTFGGPDCDLTAAISETSIVAEIDKDGDGTLRLAGINTFHGPTIVTAGTVIVDGSQPQSSARVFGGRLQGSGTVGQIELLGPSAIVAPGTGPGILTCSDFNIGAVNRGILQIDLNGTSPGAFDQINARGTVKLTGITLSASLNYASATNDQFLIINNDGADPVVDTFAGLPQNAHFYIGGQQFTVSYTGGSGNDVVLTRIPTPPRPVLTIEKLQPASVRLLWPTNATGFVLQANTNLSTTHWSDPLLPSSILGTNNAALDLTTNNQRFYRLVHP
jgi:fibronectin-binding autotransporter adhesin